MATLMTYAVLCFCILCHYLFFSVLDKVKTFLNTQFDLLPTENKIVSAITASWRFSPVEARPLTSSHYD